MPSIKSVPIVKDCQCSGKEVSTDKLHIWSVPTLKAVVLLLLILFPSVFYAQRKSDIGMFAGTSFYMGDINTSRYFYSPGFVIGPVYRYNFELRNSVRLSSFFFSLRADDRDFSDPIPRVPMSFHGNYLDAEAVYEFNFQPYKTTNRKYNQTFYLSGGLGYTFVISSDVPSKSHLTIPFGLGYKLNITKKMAGGAELTVRKTFYDNIDGVENFALKGSRHLFGNNDWYTFAGIFITYKIFNYREDCPAYDN